MFDNIEDAYLRERKSDVEFVFDRVLRNLLGRPTGPLAPPPDAVVVAYDLSPADTAQLPQGRLVSGLTHRRRRQDLTHRDHRPRARDPVVVALEDITEVV